jgi:hypothetical protein
MLKEKVVQKMRKQNKRKRIKDQDGKVKLIKI